MLSPSRNNAPGSPRINAARLSQGNLPTAIQRFSRSAAQALFERELAYYRADAPYLTIEKCAERCAKLSILLTQAQLALA